MKLLYTFLCAIGLVVFTQPVSAQTSWPKAIDAQGANLKLYEWQPESFAENTLKARAAVSVITSGKTDPVFGMAWITANTVTNNNKVTVTSATITSLKLPEDVSDDQLDDIKQSLAQQIPNLDVSFRYDQLQQSLQLNTQQNQLASEINNKPPKVIYSNVPAVLVSIDGKPEFKKNDDWGVEAVVNTPFTIVKNKDGKMYLYGGKHWYSAPTVNGPYTLTTNVGPNLRKIEQAVQEANKKDDQTQESGMEKDENTIYKIIVSTEPAELIQSKGDASMSPVDGTSLLYVSNSDDDIFMDINSQQYYVLLSGRWFQSKTLNGPWNYVPATNLPADFAKIREGSDKDNVLASVAGTDAAQDALRENEVPQTARVERDKARAEVDYDGDPQFEDIDGTDLAYATNTPSSVLRWRGNYYSVDNGVWFESRYANGPWVVAVERPYSVALIPARYPVYNLKYVYIYDVAPDYVYMGYTPGYLNAFSYGPTIVYGTGYYYRPWHHRYYYPRPCTWGYRVRYNPWFGWGFGFNYSAGWFNISIGFGNYRPWNYWNGGWWGPRYYSAPYCYRPVYHGRPYGYYNNRYYNYRSNVIVHANRTVNVYNYRRDVVTRDNQRYAPTYRYNNRRDYANSNGTINRPNRDYNRGGNDGRYNNSNNNNNNRGGRDYNYNRNNRSDYPNTRNRDVNNRPDRTYNPGNNGTRNNDGNRPGNNSGNNNNRPGGNENRPGRTYNPGNRPNYTTPGGAGNGEGRTTTPGRNYTPGTSREPVRRDFERPNNSSNNGNREASPGRSYERSNGGRTYERSNSGSSGSGRTYSPPARQSAPAERRVERREGGGGGNRSQGGGGHSQGGGGGHSERSGGRPSRS